MPNNQIKNGIKGLRDSKLTPTEKQVILVRLLRNIKLAETKSTQNWPWFIFRQTIWLQRFAPVLAVCLIILLASGGTIFASETSLPGDLLYPIKIGITEPIGDLLTIGLSAQTKRAVLRVDRRLDEAEKLASNGDLNKENLKTIKKQLKINEDKFTNLKQNLKNSSSKKELIEIDESFETKIKAHSNILNEVSSHSDKSQKNEIEELKKVVSEKVISAQKEREESETKILSEDKNTEKNNQKSFEKSKEEISGNIQTTSEQLNRNYDKSKGIKRGILENASGTLRKAQEKIKEAEDKNKTANPAEAFNSLLSARRQAEEAKISVDKSSAFDKKRSYRDESGETEARKDD